MTIKRSNIEIVDFNEGDYTDDNDDTKNHIVSIANSTASRFH